MFKRFFYYYYFSLTVNSLQLSLNRSSNKRPARPFQLCIKFRASCGCCEDRDQVNRTKLPLEISKMRTMVNLQISLLYFTISSMRKQHLALAKVA